MDLLEYQAKELFREMGIPVLPSQRIDNPRELKGLKIPYPVVLKSQVRAGGRGKAGGIRFVENTIDAIAAARTIFNLPILGEYPQVLLAESKYNADREFYLAVVLDYETRRPMLLGSPQGGINLETVVQHIQRVVVDQEFSPFYARRLLMKMGLQGSLIQSVSSVVEKMYQLFIQKDLDIVEINPLGVSPTGEIMALDGKITANYAALGRHPELVLLGKIGGGENIQTRTPYIQIPIAEREGNIGIFCNDTSLAIATMDLIYQAQTKLASCIVVPGETESDSALVSIREKWERALDHITQQKSIKVILVNVIGSLSLSEQVMQVIVSYWQRKLQRTQLGETSNLTIISPILQEQRKTLTAEDSTKVIEQQRASRRNDPKWNRLYPHFVIRLVGCEIDKNQEQLALMPLHWVENLDDAIAQAVSLAKSAAKNS